ncbi:MAG: hypothetical protein J6N72_08140 [Psychrobacter sp.]|nr:hypothetical protein [Psychrobacter sp.]
MQTYASEVHKNLSVEGSVLNYVYIPTPLGDILNEIVDEVGYVYSKANAKERVATTQAEIVAEVLSKITGKPVVFTDASMQSPMLTFDNKNKDVSMIIASVDTDQLPSLEQVKEYYSQFDVKKILLNGAQFLYEQKPNSVPLLTDENMNQPFVEWGKWLIGVYLATIMTLDQAVKILNDDSALTEAMEGNLRERLNID